MGGDVVRHTNRIAGTPQLSTRTLKRASRTQAFREARGLLGVAVWRQWKREARAKR